MQNPILDAALAYHGFGWSLLPIRQGTKKPACSSWLQFQKQPASIELIRDWFRQPGRGLAVVTGPVSGDLFCRDFDELPAYDRWAALNPDLAKILPTVATSRGRHVYCRAKFGRLQHVDSGELRGGKGYCLLPPSVHPEGMPYHWIIPPSDPIPFVDLLTTGFLSTDETESTERTERTEKTEDNRRELTQWVVSERETTNQNEKLHEAIERIIVETIPIQYGTRNRAVFQFARRMKSLPVLTDADVEELRPHARNWHSRALPYIKTDPFEETWIDFIYAWPRIKFIAGADPMTEIFSRAAQQPDAVWPYEQRELRLLASLCKELQRSAGDGPFYLSCRTAGRLLSVTHLRAWRWMMLLESDKWIQTVEKGSQEKRRATRFRYMKPL